MNKSAGVKWRKAVIVPDDVSVVRSEEGAEDLAYQRSWRAALAARPVDDPVVRECIKNPGLPSLFTELQEELGLKMERQQVTRRVLIVEQVHALKEN